MLRTHGITKNPDMLSKNDGGWYYEMQMLGYNYRLTDFQSALGLSQLKRADEGLAKRRSIAAKYDAAFKDSGITCLGASPHDNHAYHLYVILVNNRKELYDTLREKHIYAQVHYIPVHTLPFYQSLGWKYGDFPEAENYYEQCLSLPMYPTLTADEQDYVINTVLEFTQKSH